MQPLFSHVRLVLSTYDTQRSTFSILHYTYIRSTLYDGENSLSRCVSIIVQDSDNTGLFIFPFYSCFYCSRESLHLRKILFYANVNFVSSVTFFRIFV